jgi:hypothetical protein
LPAAALDEQILEHNVTPQTQRHVAAPGKLDGVSLLVTPEERNARLGCVLLQLIERAGSV